ncbi:MAG: hypothetical protein AAFU64_12135 [Bacteroidota bacterium]
MMKISFDFDDTLDQTYIQQLALLLAKAGAEVYIITRRGPTGNRDLFALAEVLWIPEKRIFFTNGQAKTETIIRLGIDLHLDDQPEEIWELSKRNIPALLVNFDWLLLQRFIQKTET